MTPFAFDPWAALKAQRETCPPAKAANLANTLPPQDPGLAALAGLAGRRSPYAKSRGGVLLLPGVPPAWCEGVALLATMPNPSTITPERWAALAVTSQRLLHDHGAALHGAGWGTLDLWGLHARAPATNPPGWGLAWLLGEHGDVLDIGPDAVGMRRGSDGARLAFRRRVGQGGSVPAWELRCSR